MLTKEDIQSLTEVLATRKEIDEGFRLVKERFDDIDERFDKLEENQRVMQTSIDNLAKMVKDFRDEHIIIHKRLEVLEEWAKQASKKLGISLPN